MNDFRKNTRLLQEKQTDGTKNAVGHVVRCEQRAIYRRSA